MAEVAMGKLLPNLKITLGNESDNDNLIEEGEISDSPDASENAVTKESSTKNVDIVRSWVTTLQNPKVYENKNGSFVTGLDLSSEVLMKKLRDRADRFGLEKKEGSQITQNEIDALYKSLEIDPENLNSCKLKNIRLDALHMRGVEEMSTNEVFKYFGDYGPASVEWINDFSCNVVWLDEATTARALLGMSQPLAVKKKNIDQNLSEDVTLSGDKKISETETVIEVSDSEESEDDRLTTDSKTESSMELDTPMDQDMSDDNTLTNSPTKDSAIVNVPVPPGHWRVGVPQPKAKAILLRFASKDDRKLPGAEKRSQYYQKYGNPNYGGLRGIISTSKKRKIQAAKNKEVIGKLTDNLQHHSDTEGDLVKQHNRMKLPRMRMYADDEEEKRKRIKINHTNSNSKPGNIYSRLGKKYTKDDLFHLGSKFSSGSDEEADDNIAINCTVPSRYNIWTDIAKSMSKEESNSCQDEEEPYHRPSRSSEFQNSHNRNSSRDRSHQDLRSSLDKKLFQNFKSRRYSRSRSPPRRGLDRSGDLRRLLNSSKRINVSGHSKDLRSKIRRLTDEKKSASKHRSPLCVDD